MDQIGTVRAHWSEIGTAGRLPDRAAVSPDRLGRAVTWTFVLETVRGELVFRIAGTGICELLGLDVRELPLMRMWSPSDAVDVDRVLANAIADGREGYLSAATRSVRGRSGTLDVALYPIRHGEGRIGFLGAMKHRPALPVALDRLASLQLTHAREMLTTDPIRAGLAAIAERRIGARSLAGGRALREAGVVPMLQLVNASPTTKR